MHQTRYRHWDGEQMIYQSKTHSFNIGGPHGNELLTWLGFNMIANEPVDNLMQFTGLTDKNGVEICEGDILLKPDNKFTNIGVVRMIHGCWMVASDDDHYFNLYHYQGEVGLIGNTHQHPELLENKQ